jgi:hypothetical protein
MVSPEKAIPKQAEIRDNSALIEKYSISDRPRLGPGTTITWLGTIHALSCSLISRWDSPGSSFPQISVGFKSSWGGDSSPDSTRSVFLSLTFNKLHLQPCVLPWILPVRHKEFGSLITDCTRAVNNPKVKVT